MTQGRHEEGAELIRKAFAVARDSGLPEWRTMTIAVLKNRLLDLTNREFNEKEWGANSFREFVEQFSDVLALVSTAHPLKVTLADDLPPRTATTVARKGVDGPGSDRRVRSDLWKAVFDYSSAAPYIWDGEQAVRLSSVATPEQKVLPTLSEEELKQWRLKFVEEQSRANPRDASLLYSWYDREDPMSILPLSLRIPWVIELKQRVVERLTAWFAEEGIDQPDILVTAPQKSPATTDVEALREYVFGVVRSMSRSELESLQLPAAAMLRRHS